MVQSSGSGTIASGSNIVIEENVTSVLDVLKNLLNQSNIAYVVKGGNYVSSIAGKGEFDGGANSGWLYSVNGVTPSSTASSEYKLKNGDSVRWYYTADYTAEPSSGSGWSKPPVTGEEVKVVISLEDLAKAISKTKEDNFEVKGKDSSLGIPSLALAEIKKQAGAENLEIIMERKPSKEDTIVVEILIKAGSKQITSFGTSPGGEANSIKVLIPVGKDHEKGKVYRVYVDSQGRDREEKAGRCIEKDGKLYVVVNTSHLSTFTVTTQVVTGFQDVSENSWYREAVGFVVEKGLFAGVSETMFMPSQEMSRAMVVTVLYRMAGSPQVAGNPRFTDVGQGKWYSQPVVWAVNKGIVKGYSDQVFGVEDPITRQDFAALMDRYEVSVMGSKGSGGESVNYGEALKEYKDGSSVAAYSGKSMAWAVNNGLIKGWEGQLLPHKTATRGEAATVLMRFAGLHGDGKGEVKSEGGLGREALTKLGDYVYSLVPSWVLPGRLKKFPGTIIPSITVILKTL